jgi:hypothetical protein
MKSLATFFALIFTTILSVCPLESAAQPLKEPGLHERCRSRVRTPLDYRGGADDFGYVYVDNQAGDTATFDWIELDSDPEAVPLTFTGRDDGYSPFIAFENGFPFYGITQDSFCVTTNGTIQFTSHSTAYTPN